MFLGIVDLECAKSVTRCVLETTLKLSALPGEVIADQITNDDPFLSELQDRAGQELYESAYNKYVGLANQIEAAQTTLGSANWTSATYWSNLINYTSGMAAVDIWAQVQTYDAPYKYKADVLAAQLDAEKDYAINAVVKKVTNYKQSGTPEIVVEIGNEPNLFPYIPPALFAKYYADWVYTIRNGVEAYQKKHPDLASFNLKFIPGGLGDVNSMKQSIVDLMGKGISFDVTGWELGFSQVTNDSEYYSTFLTNLSTYLAGSKYNNSLGVKSVIDYGNIHLYPWTQVENGSSLESSYDGIMKLVADSSNEGKTIVSEYGNITPYSDATVAKDVMTPLVNYLSSRSDIKSTYWFMYNGVDQKYALLENFPDPPPNPAITTGYNHSSLTELFGSVIHLNTIIKFFDMYAISPFVPDQVNRIKSAIEDGVQYNADLKAGHPNGAEDDGNGNSYYAAFAQLYNGTSNTLLGNTYLNLTGTCFLTNTNIPAGDLAGFVSTGRDLSLELSSTSSSGKPGVQISQYTSNYNVKHSFVFDSAWKAGNTVDVSVYVDSTELVGAAWAGTLSLATFDNYNWIALPDYPQGSSELNRARGKWVTFRYKYDPARYFLGDTFDLMFLANGHGDGTSKFVYQIGNVSLETNSDSSAETPSNGDSASTGNDTTTSNGGTTSPAIKTLSDTANFAICNQCLIASEDGRASLSVVSNGGGAVLSFNDTVDSAFRNSSNVTLDIRSSTSLSGWEYVEVAFVDAASSVYYDAYRKALPSAASNGWATVDITDAFKGASYNIGSIASVSIAVNSNASSGGRIYLSNFTLKK